MTRLPKPSANAISVVLGASERMRCGVAAIVTLRLALSVTVIEAGVAVAGIAVAVGATVGGTLVTGNFVGAAVGGIDVGVGAGAQPASATTMIDRAISPAIIFRVFIFSPE